MQDALQGSRRKLASAVTAAPRSPGLSHAIQEKIFAYGLVLPVVILLLGLVAYPFFYAILISFTDRVIGNDGHWIGLANFRYLARRHRFWRLDPQYGRVVVVSRRLKLASGSGWRCWSTSGFRRAGSSARS